MIRTASLKIALIAGTALGALACAGVADAQVSTQQTTPEAATPTSAATPTQGAGLGSGNAQTGGDAGPNEVLVTGSRIKQDPNNSALPLQIITTQELGRNGISNPEQLISYLTDNGNGADNLSSNSDVVSGAARGTNGLSAANLRGQGSASTLILLNGRRVAAHGLQGSAVDVNQIPFAAIDRVEVLKDGASAIYGTDAVGGVINFITKKNFTGLDLVGFQDITQEGDAPIRRVSATAGWGKLDEQGFNIMGSVSKSWNGSLFGYQRDFINGNQPNRGLSIDTRGTPIATAFPINPTAAGVGITQNGTLLGGTTAATGALTGAGFYIPGTTTLATGGVNPLRLPGGGGCDSVDGGMNYDPGIFSVPTAALACSWDTSRAATLQQPIDTLTYYGRATARIGGRHEIFGEVTGSNANSSKVFSNNQYSANNTSLPIAYPLNALTAPTYNAIYNQLVAVLPAIAANYGKPIAYRWRCVDCGGRQYDTNSKTFRAALGADGPLAAGWDYRVGGSYANSTASSVLGGGYSYSGVFRTAQEVAYAKANGYPNAVIGGVDPRAPTAPGASAPGIVGLLNSGILNPFSLTQTPAALAALDAVSADGVKLYGGKYETWQFDGSVSGSLFRLPGGTAKVALGVDYRRESYRFGGSPYGDGTLPDIYNAAFDNGNVLGGVNRTVKAAYAEALFPIFEPLEISLAGRVDDYTGFGSTWNPKISAKLRPVNWLMFRGSYNTAFRVPTFNQIFNGTLESPNTGTTLVDPTTCPSGVVGTGGCASITPNSLSGGNVNLGPETAKEYSLGAVFQPSRHFSLSADYWSIAVDNVIGTITLQQLFANINAFSDRITRDANGIITGVDLRTGNFGSRRTKGIDFTGRASIDGLGGSFIAGIDGTLLLEKKEKLLPNLRYADLIGVFSLTGDLGLKWKHNAYVGYSTEGFSATFTQIYRDGYANQVLSAAAAARPDFDTRVKPYIIYNASVSKTIADRMTLIAGIRNVFNTDPPFAIDYDANLGAGGGGWEPRVADPRGRSFTLSVETKF